MTKKLLDNINEKLAFLSESYGFSIYPDDKSIKIEFNGYVGLQLVIDYDEENVDFRFWVRTSSWYYIDERTDIHDIINLLFAVLLKANKISSSTIIYDYNSFGIPEVELYSSFSVTSQSNYSIQKRNEYINSLLDLSLFFQLWFAETFGCPCHECSVDKNLRIGTTEDISKSFKMNIFSTIGESVNINYKKRFYPSWEYFRDFDKNITFVKDKKVSQFVYELSDKNETEIFLAINGQLIKTENLYNYISLSTIRRVKKIIKSLTKNKEQEIRFIILDNVAIFSTQNYIIAVNGRFGLFEYKKEKDKLRDRHMREFELLFSPTDLKWAEEVSPERFENLIKELLERDTTIEWVRKYAHTNEPDGGRDLICRKLIPNPNPGENAPTSVPIDVIVQCKFYKGGVGKDRVLDIRDTVEHSNYSGYLLVVSSYTKKSLTEHLDVLRKKGTLWIDWWTQDEIFDRIKLYPDLISKYSDLLII